jgi:hypothetical protein
MAESSANLTHILIKPLTENEVKRSALRYLKTYYKYRPRSGETTARLDMMAPGGIIADGHLSFPKEDGSTFLATFEATSYNTRHEVDYAVQKPLLIADSAVLALIVVTGMLGYADFVLQWSFQRIGLWESIAIYFTMVMGFSLLFMLLLRGFRRYHYIYAIEQFKRYHADEQWVALAADAFANPEDHRLLELKENCVRNGFGLLLIDEKQIPHLLITPSREDVFEGKRLSLDFVDGNVWAERLGKPIGFLKKIWNWLGGQRIQPAFEYSSTRFRILPWKQILVGSVALLFTGLIFYEEYRQRPVESIDYASERERIRLEVLTTTPETERYLVDEHFIDSPFDGPNRAYHPLFIDPIDFRERELERKRREALEAEEVSAEVISDLPDDLDAAEPVADVRAADSVSDCGRFAERPKRSFLVLESAHDLPSVALSRMRVLQREGLEAEVAWMRCFQQTGREYGVFLGWFYESYLQASIARDSFLQVLSQEQRLYHLEIVEVR